MTPGSEPVETFADLVRARFDDQQLDELWRATGIKPDVRFKLLRGLTKNPKVVQVARLAVALDMPPERVRAAIKASYAEANG